MTVARATVFYCILCGRRKESAALRVMTQHHRRKLTQQHRKNNKQHRENNTIAEAITRKPIQYNKFGFAKFGKI